MKKPVVVAVSGGFDPIHIGHIRMFQEAKALGDELVVILNNDNWLHDKKGFPFMAETERKEIIESIKGVDRVVLTDHTIGDPDRSVCRALQDIKPDIFANGGDRKPDDVPVPEVGVCEELAIKMVYNVGTGGKVQSSSWLIKKAAEKSSDTKKDAHKLHENHKEV
ncbi:MAG: adenylyltransferase/cytidyltransferase family protein [Candidatus Paceibacteria bacterium]